MSDYFNCDECGWLFERKRANTIIVKDEIKMFCSEKCKEDWLLKGDKSTSDEKGLV